MVKGWYEREYRSVCESEEGYMLFDIYTEYANEAWQQGVRASQEVVYIQTDEVKIYPCFAAHKPKPEKMEQKEQHFTETGLLQSQIILDSRGNLIDGYTSYLLARAHGIQCVPIRYGRRQIVRASHKPGGKLYTWELPGILIDRVSIFNILNADTEKLEDGYFRSDRERAYRCEAIRQMFCGLRKENQDKVLQLAMELLIGQNSPGIGAGWH